MVDEPRENAQIFLTIQGYIQDFWLGGGGPGLGHTHFFEFL